MRRIALPLGSLILLWTLLDVFRTLVMPRAARGRFRLSRILFRGGLAALEMDRRAS